MSAPDATIVEPPRPAPRSPAELFVAFTVLSLQGFGGVLPVAQRELVEKRRWLERREFAEMLAVCQLLPGPNVVNLSLMVGDRSFGTRGALAAMAGMLSAPLLVVLALARAYAEFAHHPAVAGALRGIGAVAVGLVVSTAIKLLGTLRENALGRPTALAFAACMTLATGVLHWPLLAVLPALGATACIVAWRRIGERARPVSYRDEGAP